MEANQFWKVGTSSPFKPFKYNVTLLKDGGKGMEQCNHTAKGGLKSAKKYHVVYEWPLTLNGKIIRFDIIYKCKFEMKKLMSHGGGGVISAKKCHEVLEWPITLNEKIDINYKCQYGINLVVHEMGLNYIKTY